MKRHILFGVLFASMALCSIFAAGIEEEVLAINKTIHIIIKKRTQ